MDTLTGSVERITFYNPENGYSVLRLRPDSPRHTPGMSRDGLVTVVGNLPELSAGEHLRLSGTWTNHPRHGQQFQVEICEQTLPATVAGMRRYLGSGLVRGIGARLAERIVDHFGQQTLEVIEQQPERLREVADIGPKRAALIARAWEEQQQVKQIMLFLHSHAVSTNLAVKIYKHYGEQALAVVQSDPYRLARDIYGIGFKTADRIAQALGLPADHPSRIEAGVLYALNEMSDDGHVFSPRLLLEQRAAELLGLPAGLIPPALLRLAADELIRNESLPFLAGQPELARQIREAPQPGYSSQVSSDVRDAVYLAALYQCEVGVAQRLQALAQAAPRLAPLASLVESAAAKLDQPLSAEQRRAVESALLHPLSVLTGGPGTGKTTALRALIAVIAAARRRPGGGVQVALASPTGRAAKRLSEATGQPASTIHRLLGFSPGEGFAHNSSNPLPVDLLVVDEASMLDLVLANHLVKALKPGTHLLLVGDVDQLPSVGAGDVLRDVIASGAAPVTRLSQIFRQAAESHIISNAHRINQGEMPVFDKNSRDFFLFPAETAEEAASWVEQVVCQRIPEKFGLHPRDQVQVLAPMYRGPAGVQALNERLQQALNPASALKPEKRLFGYVFRQGDKVMQVQNNYEKEVFNGDIGTIVGLDVVDQSLSVEIDGRRIPYDWNEADQLVQAYAVTVHKAQGSEFPAVVLPLVTGHYMMLQRNLLYTAVTRAKQLCVLVGSRKALAMAVKNNKVAERYTALDWRIRG